jgi:hypothetical protein
MADKDLRDLERYFRDPRFGDRVLEADIACPACKNIRQALRALGFHGEFGQIDFSENYDVTLAQHVLRFQEALKHTSRDGRFRSSCTSTPDVKRASYIAQPRG